mgnify:CR=1 FL=1
MIRLLNLNATPPDDGDNQVVLGVGEAVADEESGDDVAQDEGVNNSQDASSVAPAEGDGSFRNL